MMALPDSDKLRDRATQLLAMALKARETGLAAAAEFEKLASEALAQAEDMESGAAALLKTTLKEFDLNK
jgi:hypothetical protein